MITTAIIPVAGYGTRRLPITKAIEKCMLPIGNRPIVDYVVADCIAAGLTDIYFVISPNSYQLQDYYSHNIPLEDFLQKHQKSAELATITPPAQVNFHCIVQGLNDKYGSAIPVALAYKQILKDGLSPSAPVAVLTGDDFIYRSDGGSTVADLITAYESANPVQQPPADHHIANLNPAEPPAAPQTTTTNSTTTETSILLGATISKDNPNKYGFLELDNTNNLIKITESLTAAEAPTNLINASKYLMSPALLRSVANYVTAETTEPEYYLTTTPFSNYLAAGHQIRVIPASGEYLDGGSLSGWLHANQVIAKAVGSI